MGFFLQTKLLTLKNWWCNTFFKKSMYIRDFSDSETHSQLFYLVGDIRDLHPAVLRTHQAGCNAPVWLPSVALVCTMVYAWDTKDAEMMTVRRMMIMMDLQSIWTWNDGALPAFVQWHHRMILRLLFFVLIMPAVCNCMMSNKIAF